MEATDRPTGKWNVALSAASPSGMLISGRRVTPAPPTTAASEGTGNGHRLGREQTKGAAPAANHPEKNSCYGREVNVGNACGEPPHVPFLLCLTVKIRRAAAEEFPKHLRAEVELRRFLE